MTNKEIISQLQELKKIKADQEWKKKTRDFLYAKISEENNENNSILLNNSFIARSINSIKNFFAQPSFAVIVITALIIGSCLFGVRAINSMPGDSLYIAQIISEKAQLAITFDQEKKTKLGIKFASDHAKKITDVLAQAKVSNGFDGDKEELIQNFKKEINIVKDKIATIQNNEPQDQDKIFFSANLEKDDKGLNISSNYSEEKNETNEVQETESISAHEILNQAEKLFDQQDYNGAKQKIEEIDALINLENNNNEESTENSLENQEQTEEEPTADTATSTESIATSTELN